MGWLVAHSTAWHSTAKHGMSGTHREDVVVGAATGSARKAKSGHSKPYKYGIIINRPKTESLAEKALQVETMTARRHVKELHDSIKMPVPRVPAVLAYLRWLDRMDAWHRRSSSLNSTSARLRDTEELYSWNGDFGAPIVLPKIRKHPKPEKYHSNQLQDRIMDPKLMETSGKRSHPDYAGSIHRKQAERRVRAAYSLAASKGASAPQINFQSPGRSRTGSVESHEKAGPHAKHTKFYIHAMNGFKYWPEERYNPPIHHTKYSFGTQFNPGRAGVLVDRIYTRPSSNKHYWSEYQLHQNPIGSGNTVTGNVLSN